MSDEAYWIEQSIKGDHQAFERLVFAYEQRLMRFLRARSSRIELVDDAFQETFINAFRYIKNYDNRYAFSTWLFNIAVNALNHQYRKENKHSINAEETDVERCLDEVEGSDMSIDQQLESANVWRIADQILPQKQVHLLWLHYVEGYIAREIAVILECSIPWVKINLIRSKSKLRKFLESQQANHLDWVV
ncbi:RNA polymerase sigma factor [Pleionea litopenaei]|uniref:Sigma-70 family RNA polymerase sigma factor n=1 Tax=Pleionea litopenaei TaxID=3070815 RepID=A0AA51X6N0_9GAMM|nr:sigma-70 family RNA polymerase sigma factor [Pleionea sp. HL-JVS1]WMS87024.1 sigma-70 family RNA polymerase sigma factor [Pleionea sp. HL-JVS1]